MKLTGTILKESVDAQNDRILVAGCKFPDEVPVTWNFNNSLVIGKARIEKVGFELKAVIELSPASEISILTMMLRDGIQTYGVIGGFCGRESQDITDYKLRTKTNIDSVALCLKPADSQLRPLEILEERNDS